jgi:hypothetical protein
LLTKQYVDEHQLVERYLADQLSDAERNQFEDYYAENPDALRDLDAVAGIKLGVALLRESGELAALTAARPAPRWRAGLAMAATLLVAIVAGAYWFRNDAGPPVILASNLDAFGSPLPLAASYQVQRTRSDVDVSITLPPSPQAIRLRVRAIFDPPPPASYRVELLSLAETSDGRTTLAATGKFGLDADGFVTIYLNSAHLRPGNYELKVADEAAAAADPDINDFLIEVTTGTSAPVR